MFIVIPLLDYEQLAEVLREVDSRTDVIATVLQGSSHLMLLAFGNERDSASKREVVLRVCRYLHFL